MRCNTLALSVFRSPGDEARAAYKQVVDAIRYLYSPMCRRHLLYTGLTKDLSGRIREHELGMNPDSYTFSGRPVKLVCSVIADSYQDAFQWEHRIKGWSRAKKEALIRGDIAGIHEVVRAERKRREQEKKSR